MLPRNPVDGALHAPPFPGSGAGGRIIGAFQLGYLTLRVFNNFVTLDDIGVFKTYFAVRLEAEELLGSVFHEVGALDVELSAEGDLAARSLGLSRVERTVKPFHLPFGPVGDGELDRILDHHVAVRPGVEVLPYAPFQQLDVHELLVLADTDLVAEHLDGLGSIAAAPHSAEGGHARVVPAGDYAFLHELEQFALAHEGIGEVQPGEFVLMARIDVQDLDEPVVEGTVHVEFEGADAVGYILYGVALAVGVVVHRVDAPFVAGAVMRRVLDAVHDGIAEHHVGRSHVDLSPEHLLAVGILAVSHLAEKP